MMTMIATIMPIMFAFKNDAILHVDFGLLLMKMV